MTPSAAADGAKDTNLLRTPKWVIQKVTGSAPPERALPSLICSINILPLWGKYPPYLPTVFAIAEVVKKSLQRSEMLIE